ncbi:hypothetical protein DMC47_10335 [Nostoc sp. 3335mG]|nr:hypothetical protein DMC47_10335 [Nostoc sp. 3335mG]
MHYDQNREMPIALYVLIGVFIVGTELFGARHMLEAGALVVLLALLAALSAAAVSHLRRAAAERSATTPHEWVGRRD